jgi:hypothetical protein
LADRVLFQYQHFNLLGQTFHDIGFNLSITRHMNDWSGREGNAAVGFGSIGKPININANINAKSTFTGGGPRLVKANATRFEPWGHVLIGWDHFRFTETNNVIRLGRNSAIGFMAGGGMGFKLFPHAYWRVQGDGLGPRFGNTGQFNYSIGLGVVLNCKLPRANFFRPDSGTLTGA